MNKRQLSKKLNKLSTAELKLVCKEMGCSIGNKKIMISNLLNQVQKVETKNVENSQILSEYLQSKTKKFR